MALFKVFSGPDELLNDIPLHYGYAYVCEDSGNFYIDVSEDEDTGRIQINAHAADVLRNDVQEIKIDDIFLKNMIAEVSQGGTGRKTLTKNALLLGNDTDAVKMVSLDQGALLVGNDEEGVIQLLGKGVLVASTSGAPKFESVLSLEMGGTGATTATAARNNLDVYDKGTVDNNIEKVTTVSFTTTLTPESWSSNEDGTFQCEYNNTDLACGQGGDVCPIITYTLNQKEYNYITKAEATPGIGIVFTASKQPEESIGIIIIDNK